MKILAFEFSSPQRSVAVMNDRGTSGSEVIEAAPGNSMKPLGMVEAALKQAGLEREQIGGIVVGLGPGSYTGIRVAIALAQGWQLATGVKLLGISSAEGIAAQAQTEGITGRACVVIDAQREEFCVASYELGAQGQRQLSPLRLAARPEVGAREGAGEILIGPEVTRWFPNGRVVSPRAETLARLALGRNDFVAGQDLSPIYLRATSFVKAPPARSIA